MYYTNNFCGKRMVQKQRWFFSVFSILLLSTLLIVSCQEAGNSGNLDDDLSEFRSGTVDLSPSGENGLQAAWDPAKDTDVEYYVIELTDSDGKKTLYRAEATRTLVNGKITVVVKVPKGKYSAKIKAVKKDGSNPEEVAESKKSIGISTQATPPQPPEGVATQESEGQATSAATAQEQVKWNVPHNSGNRHDGTEETSITYILYWRKADRASSLPVEIDYDGKKEVENPSATDAVLDSLDPNSEYEIVVIAVNSAGLKSPGVPLSVTTEESFSQPPEKPIISATPRSTTEEPVITLVWSKPDAGVLYDNQQADVMGYMVLWKPGNSLNVKIPKNNWMPNVCSLEESSTDSSAEDSAEGWRPDKDSPYMENNEWMPGKGCSRGGPMDGDMNYPGNNPEDYPENGFSSGHPGDPDTYPDGFPGGHPGDPDTYPDGFPGGHPGDPDTYPDEKPSRKIPRMQWAPGADVLFLLPSSSGGGKVQLTVGLEKGKTYAIRVIAINNEGRVAISDVETVDVPSVSSLARRPKGVNNFNAVEVSDSITINLNWDVNTDFGLDNNGNPSLFKEYRIYWALGSYIVMGGSPLVISAEHTDSFQLTHDIHGLLGASEYTIVIYTENTDGLVSNAVQLTAKTADLSERPGSVAHIQKDEAYAEADQFRITWTAGTPAKNHEGKEVTQHSYRIYFIKNDGSSRSADHIMSDPYVQQDQVATTEYILKFVDTTLSYDVVIVTEADYPAVDLTNTLSDAVQYTISRN